MFELTLFVIAYALIAVLALACVGVLLTPLYFWLLWRDSMTAEARKRELQESSRLLREIDSERHAARQ